MMFTLLAPARPWFETVRYIIVDPQSQSPATTMKRMAAQPLEL